MFGLNDRSRAGVRSALCGSTGPDHTPNNLMVLGSNTRCLAAEPTNLPCAQMVPIRLLRIHQVCRSGSRSDIAVGAICGEHTAAVSVLPRDLDFQLSPAPVQVLDETLRILQFLVCLR
jgi:hypothetical protein